MAKFTYTTADAIAIVTPNFGELRPGAVNRWERAPGQREQGRDRHPCW